MTVTTDTDRSGNIERISITSQATTVPEELANCTGMLREVCPFVTVIDFERRWKFPLHIYRRRSEDETQMEMVITSLSGEKFHGVHRGHGWRHSFRHRVPPPPFVG